MKITENISYHVAAGKISKELLHKIMTAIMDGTYEKDEELKLEIMNAIVLRTIQKFLIKPFIAAINEDFFCEHWIASKNIWEQEP